MPDHNPMTDAPPLLVDSHCHLDFPDFEGEVDAIIARARAAGVTRMVTICTRLGGLARVHDIVAAHDGLYFAAGLHPLSVGKEPAITTEELVALTAHPKMVGIGETGLDYHYTPETAPAQRDSLRAHIAAAQQTGLPLIIHARDADADMEAILREGFDEKPYTCVMHCFSSGAALAQAALEMGFYLSMSGIATFRNSDTLRAIFAAAPLDRILVETDSPYLAPVPLRGKRNEPANVVHTARVGADLFGLSLEEFAAATSANFERLFTRAAS